MVIQRLNAKNEKIIASRSCWSKEEVLVMKRKPPLENIMTTAEEIYHH